MEVNSEIEEKLTKVYFKEPKHKGIARDILVLLWGENSYTKTQLKNKLLEMYLEKSNANLGEIINLLIDESLIEKSIIKSEIKVIKRKK